MFHGDRVLVREEEKVLETDGGGGGTALCVCLMSLSYALKSG